VTIVGVLTVELLNE